MKIIHSFKEKVVQLIIKGDISIAVFRSIIAICLIPIFILCLSFITFYIAESEKQNNNYFEANRQLAETQIHKLFENYEAETRILTNQLNNLNQEDLVRSDAYINSTLVNILNSYPELEGVLFRNNQRQYYVESRDAFDTDKFDREYGASDPTRTDLVIRELRLESFLGETKPLLVMYRNLFDPNLLTSVQPSNAYLGTIYLFLRSDSIDDIIKTSDTNEQLDYYISYQNRIVYTPEKTQKKLTFSEDTVLNSYDATLQRTANISISPSLFLDQLKIITLRNQSRQLMNKPSYWIFLFLSIIIAVGIPVLIYYVINRTTIRPLELLVLEITQVHGDNYRIDTSEIPDNELGVLSHKINQMLEDLFTYHEQLTNAEVKQKEAEIRALKSQIQPHYLYNTLEVIRMSAIINHDDNVAKMIKHLSNQLEYILRETNQELVPLLIEVNNVIDYLELINVRFEGNIRYQIDIEPTVEKLLIPRLTLQPLVENSIKHGLALNNNQGDISISGYEDLEEYVIEILDNGVGMTKLELASLERHMNEPTDHLGVSIVHVRLQDHFGPTSGLTISSKKEHWTLVRIIIPKERAL